MPLSHNPWNKGIPRTDEEKLNISIARKEWYKIHDHPKGMLGKSHSEETRGKLSENLRSEEVRQKQKVGFWLYCQSKRVLYICPACGKEEMLPPSKVKTKKFCSYSCANKFAVKKRRVCHLPQCFECGKRLSKYQSLTNLCKLHANQKRILPEDQLKCNINKHIRATTKYYLWRHECFERDGFKCQDCGLSSKAVRLQLHHIVSLSKLIFDYQIKNVKQALDEPGLWNKKNAITLCVDCHKKTDSYLSRKL